MTVRFPPPKADTTSTVTQVKPQLLKNEPVPATTDTNWARQAGTPGWNQNQRAGAARSPPTTPTQTEPSPASIDPTVASLAGFSELGPAEQQQLSTLLTGVGEPSARARSLVAEASGAPDLRRILSTAHRVDVDNDPRFRASDAPTREMLGTVLGSSAFRQLAPAQQEQLVTLLTTSSDARTAMGDGSLAARPGALEQLLTKGPGDDIQARLRTVSSSKGFERLTGAEQQALKTLLTDPGARSDHVRALTDALTLGDLTPAKQHTALKHLIAAGTTKPDVAQLGKLDPDRARALASVTNEAGFGTLSASEQQQLTALIVGKGEPSAKTRALIDDAPLLGQPTARQAEIMRSWLATASTPDVENDWRYKNFDAQTKVMFKNLLGSKAFVDLRPNEQDKLTALLTDTDRELSARARTAMGDGKKLSTPAQLRELLAKKGLPADAEHDVRFAALDAAGKKTAGKVLDAAGFAQLEDTDRQQLVTLLQGTGEPSVRARQTLRTVGKRFEHAPADEQAARLRGFLTDPSHQLPQKPLDSKFAQQLAGALVDQKVDLVEVDALIRSAKAGKALTPELKAQVQGWLETQGAAAATPEARAKIAAFLSTAAVQRADPTVMANDAGAIDFRSVSHGKLFIRGAGVDDVKQGGIGDCYVMATLASLALSDPKVIESALKDNGDGTCDVRFFNSSGKPVIVTVDKQVPVLSGTKNPAYGASGDSKSELWVAMIEKAYAQWRGGYDAIGFGGQPGEVMSALTGRAPTSAVPEDTQAAALFRKMKAAVDEKRPVTGNSFEDVPGPTDGTVIVPRHAYTVLSLEEIGGERYVTLRNPWGGGKGERSTQPGLEGKETGVFQMRFEDFRKTFGLVHMGG